MERTKKTIYLSIAVILIVLLLFLLIKLYPIYKVLFLFIGRLLTPFLVASFISYLLYPIILKLNQYKISKGFAVIIIYILFFSAVSFLFYKSFPVFVHQLQDLSEQLPQFVRIYEDIIYSLYESTSFLPEIVHDKMDDLISRIETSVEKQIEHVLEKATNIFDFVVILTIIPVLVFYFLKDFEKMKASFRKVVPVKHHEKFETILYAIDDSLGGYVRGQLIISSAIIFITYAVYHTVQLKYALVLAVIMGLTNLIPYFGPIIGTVPAVAVAMTTSWKLVIIVLVTTVIVQILENSFLSPYIMGKSVQIHPVIIIFTLLIGAEIGGIIGMIIAVPAITIVRAIFVQIYANK
ncbi:MAG TPA: AI-2E family transporter [Pseudogracilibacillus sp.]|nr:AI-2E family transporter [Pseudogracilibacillus sp.]